MTVSLPGRLPETFEIKSATLPMVALMLKSPDLERLAKEMLSQFGDTPGFFDQDPIIVDLTRLDAAASVGFPDLIAVLRDHHLVPVAVRGGTPQQVEAAMAAGLANAPEARVIPTPAAGHERAEKKGATPAAENGAAAPSPSALLIDKPLRSGQQVYARGRDLVAIAPVNPGAEIIADGHIHAYAPLRGRAIAGARGNAEARIFTLCLEAELLSIAGVYRTADPSWPAGVHGKPAQVRLKGDAGAETFVFDPIHT